MFVPGKPFKPILINEAPFRCSTRWQTAAYYESPIITDLKRFITFARGIGVLAPGGLGIRAGAPGGGPSIVVGAPGRGPGIGLGAQAYLSLVIDLRVKILTFVYNVTSWAYTALSGSLY